MGVMEALTAVFTITLPLMATILLSNRQTQRIIQNSNSQTQRIIQNLSHQTQRIIQNSNSQTQRIIHTTTCQTLKLLHEIKDLQKDICRCLLKLDFGFEANAAMHGWVRRDGVSPEDAELLPDPKVYNSQLGICYYKVD